MAILSTLRSKSFAGFRSAFGQIRDFSAGGNGASKSTNKKWWMVGGVLLGMCGSFGVAMYTVDANKMVAKPPANFWPHKQLLGDFDHGSMRRGYLVYKRVCSTCHALQYLRYHDLIGQTHTREEAEKEAAEVSVLDGPDDAGLMFERPGKLTDNFLGPYKNEGEARAANNGALPPDLTYIVLARGDQGGEDYVFYFLMSFYEEAPAGVKLGVGQAWNPFFDATGGISMPKVLFDGMMTFEDGLPASVPRMAYDATTFLAWTGDRHMAERKKMALKVFPLLAIMTLASFYCYRIQKSHYSTESLKTIKRLRAPGKEAEW